MTIATPVPVSVLGGSRWHALILGAALLLRGSAVWADPPAGEVLFRRYCASCHGVTGRGDGPAAAALSPRPTDLTRITSSDADLMRQIDGRRTVRAHGTADMPVWGEVFERELSEEPFKGRTSLLKSHILAQYVHDLQKPAKSP